MWWERRICRISKDSRWLRPLVMICAWILFALLIVRQLVKKAASLEASIQTCI